MSVRHVVLDQVATPETFDEESYLAANRDVAKAVASRAGLATGRQHFDLYGQNERRRQRLAKSITPLRRTKLDRLRPYLRLDMAHERRGDKYDFLTDSLKREGAIVETGNVSANLYPNDATALIERHANGLVLDCGAGRRDIYYENVVNFEIVDYDTTDVLGIGESLPFVDASFDAVISIAVLEHVRNPFACAREIARVLKPGGELHADVPFLQPLHGFPNHYYNMTHQGLRALFEDSLIIDAQRVDLQGLPVWTLTWFLREWADGLPPTAREEFLAMRVGDLTRTSEDTLIGRSWVRELPQALNFRLASMTSLRAHKPG
jgi:SAM-dependent methyltransferase